MADQEKIERSHDPRISDHAVSQTQDGLFQQEVPQGKAGINMRFFNYSNLIDPLMKISTA